MKKSLLIAASVVLSASAFAQGARKAAINRPVKATAEYQVESTAFPAAGTKSVSGPGSHQTSSVCNPVRFTSSVNAFAVGGGVTTYQQNCLAYNQDLNQVIWTSRVSQDWTFPGKTVGAIQSTWMDVATSVWDSMIIYRDSTNARGARYPGGVMFNPTGNTTVAGSQLVGSGSVTGGTGWLGAWYSNRQPSGNYHATGIPNQVNFCGVGTAPFGNLGNSSTNCGFLNLDMQQHGQDVLVGGAMFDYTAPTEAKGGIIAKGSYSGGNFTWTADSIVPGFLSNNLGLMSDGLGGRLAFDPTGQIGYYVFNGRLSTNYNNNADSTMMPIVYKTTNGGANWTMVLAGYDWEVEHPEITHGVGVIQGISGVHPTISSSHGIDLTVDKNGVLHYVAAITLPYQNGRYAGGGHDSLQYTYTYKWDHVNTHPEIWDLMTDGTCWKTMLVDSIISAYVGSDPAADTTAAFSAWTNAAVFLPYGAHLTVSRSTDGGAVFYGWGDSDPNVTGTPYNSQPDMIIKGLDVTTNMVTPTTNVTNGVGACFFSYLADISYFDNTLSKWVVPFAYTVGRVQSSPGVYNGMSPVDYYYGNCANFGASDFNMPAIINQQVTMPCAIGIATQANLASSVSNYPNPFNHNTNIIVKLEEAQAVDVKVYNAMGSLVFSKKVNGNPGENTIVFDGSAHSAGVYYYTVSVGNEKVTKKMVIQK